MPDLSIWELFETESLTSLYRGTIEDLRPNALFDFYTPGSPGTFETDEVKILTMGEVSRPAPLNNPGQPARVLNLHGAGDAKLTGIRAFNTIPITGRTLDLLRSFEPGGRRNPSPVELSIQREGEGLLAREMRKLAERHTLTKRQYVAKYLTSTLVYIGGDGRILENSTGSVISIPTGIPAANMGSIPLGSGGANLIDALWTAETDGEGTALILDQLDAINDYGATVGRQPIRHVWLNTVRRKNVRNNGQLKTAFGAPVNDDGESPAFTRATAADSVEVDKYVFHFLGDTYEAGAESDAGTRVPFIPANKAILTPEPSDGDWLVHGVGRTPIPTDLGIHMDLRSALAGMSDVYGDFSYMALEHNVLALHAFVGFAWLFGLQAPENIYVATIAS